MASTVSASPATSMHGTKRKTEDDLAVEQRLAKRFHLLALGKPKHQITAEDIQRVQQQLDQNRNDQDKSFDSMIAKPRARRSRSNAFSDSMNVDDSRDRIFISNLEDELADLSSDEEHPIFIPDIEKKLNMLPKGLLRPDKPDKANNELVLYEVPSSLSIPAEHDSARKAILESRRRAQQQALDNQSGSTQSLPPDPIEPGRDYADEDAMDLS